MDVKFINPFLYGTIEVLKTMAFVECRTGKAYLKSSSVAHGDVSGVIGITGDMIGTLAISFGEQCICHIAGSMLGESFAEANKEVFDAVGEITNMISGVARKKMEKEGLQVYAAIPSVVYGKDHTISHKLKTPSIVIPFDTDHGSFAIDICVKRSGDDPAESKQYGVVNKKTEVISTVAPERKSPPQPADNPLPGKKAPPPAAPVLGEPKTFENRKEMLLNKLNEVTDIRDKIVKQLSDNAFMGIPQRQEMKKKLALVETQIKRLKLDLSTADMLANIPKESLENPKIVPHFQHHDSGKRKS